MKLRQTCATALLMCLAVACSSSEQWVGTVTDSAGITLVSNPDAGMWAAGAEWTIQEELRIGALEGEPDYQFGQVGSIAVDSEGRIYVLDSQAQEIKAYSPAGQYLRTIGTKGSGPGELRGASFVLIASGDTLMVPDLQSQRISLFATDGTFLSERRINLQDGLPMVFRATASGVISQQVRPFGLPNQPAADSMDAIMLLASDASVTDTLMRFPSGKSFSFAGGVPEFNIYSPEPVWDVTETLQLLFATNNEYRIKRYARDGTLETIITKPFELRAVEERDQQLFMDFLDRTWQDAGVPPAAIAQLRDAVSFGPSLPALAAVLAGAHGIIWVQHIQRASDLDEEQLESYNLIEDIGAPDWDVIDASGRFLGVVTMPPRFAPRAFREDKIYGVWRDDLDVQYVMRLRVVGLAESATD